MRRDLFTTTPHAAELWCRANLPDTSADATPSPRDLIPADEYAPGEPGPFADAFRKSVAEVQRIKGGAAVALLLALLLSSCGGSHNTDPRNGVVYVTFENCLTGGCFNITKVCIGPDLVWRDTRTDPDLVRTFSDSPECEVQR